MRFFRQFYRQLKASTSDDNFLTALTKLEGVVSKLLSLVMVVVIVVAIYDLLAFVVKELFTPPFGRFGWGKTLFTIFGLFLNVLIALEILENITAYLKKHVVQVELVIVTSLIAVARKIIILDLEKTEGINLIALAVAIFALSVSYWIVRRVTPRSSH